MRHAKGQTWRLRSKQAEIVALRTGGMSIAEIAKRMGCAYNAIVHRLRKDAREQEGE